MSTHRCPPALLPPTLTYPFTLPVSRPLSDIVAFSHAWTATSISPWSRRKSEALAAYIALQHLPQPPPSLNPTFLSPHFFAHGLFLFAFIQIRRRAAARQIRRRLHPGEQRHVLPARHCIPLCFFKCAFPLRLPLISLLSGTSAHSGGVSDAATPPPPHHPLCAAINTPENISCTQFWFVFRLQSDGAVCHWGRRNEDAQQQQNNTTGQRPQHARNVTSHTCVSRID